MNSNLRFKKKLVSFISALCFLGTSQGVSYAMDITPIDQKDNGMDVDASKNIKKPTILPPQMLLQYAKWVGTNVVGVYVDSENVLLNDEGYRVSVNGKYVSKDNLPPTVTINGQKYHLVARNIGFLLKTANAHKNVMDSLIGLLENNPLNAIQGGALNQVFPTWHYQIPNKPGWFIMGPFGADFSYAVKNGYYALVYAKDGHMPFMSMEYPSMAAQLNNVAAPDNGILQDLAGTVENVERFKSLHSELLKKTSNVKALNEKYYQLKQDYDKLVGEYKKATDEGIKSMDSVKNLSVEIQKKNKEMEDAQNALEIEKSEVAQLKVNLYNFKFKTKIVGAVGGVTLVGLGVFGGVKATQAYKLKQENDKLKKPNANNTVINVGNINKKVTLSTQNSLSTTSTKNSVSTTPKKTNNQNIARTARTGQRTNLPRT